MDRGLVDDGVVAHRHLRLSQTEIRRVEVIDRLLDGRLFTVGILGKLTAWDAATGDLLKTLTIPKKEWAYDCVRCLDCSPD